VKAVAFEPVPPTVLTETVTGPATFAGVLAVMVVVLTIVTDVAGIPAKATVLAMAKFEPVIVTFVPPVRGPLTGETLVIVGAGM
jgi:hypothetical protein